MGGFFDCPSIEDERRLALLSSHLEQDACVVSDACQKGANLCVLALATKRFHQGRRLQVEGL